MIKAVIFDMDGVIADTEPLQQKAYKIALKEQSIDMQPIDFSENTGRKDILQRIAKKYGKEVNFEKFYVTKNKIYHNLIRKGINLIEGIKELLEELEKNNFRIALASTSSLPNLNLILNKLKIRDKFEVIVGPESIKKGKPDPEIFLLTAKKLNLKPEECLVLEDTVHGVKAAKNANMKCIAITAANRIKQDLSEADLIVKTAKEIDLNIIRNIGNE